MGEMNQVFNVMDQLAGDSEPSVRAELMEQVGQMVGVWQLEVQT